jgi:hypothetical protein
VLVIGFVKRAAVVFATAFAVEGLVLGRELGWGGLRVQSAYHALEMLQLALINGAVVCVVFAICFPLLAWRSSAAFATRWVAYSMVMGVLPTVVWPVPSILFGRKLTLAFHPHHFGLTYSFILMAICAVLSAAMMKSADLTIRSREPDPR